MSGLSLTQLGLQSVVCFGSCHRGGVAVAMEPVDFTGAGVTTLLAFEGTHPRYGARAVHERHVVDGNTPVETGANRFERQLQVGGRLGLGKADDT